MSIRQASSFFSTVAYSTACIFHNLLKRSPIAWHLAVSSALFLFAVSKCRSRRSWNLLKLLDQASSAVIFRTIVKRPNPKTCSENVRDVTMLMVMSYPEFMPCISTLCHLDWRPRAEVLALRPPQPSLPLQAPFSSSFLGFPLTLLSLSGLVPSLLHQLLLPSELSLYFNIL